MDNQQDNRNHDHQDDERDNEASMDDFRQSFGENFSDTIDIDTWRIGENLAEIYSTIEKELLSAKQDEQKNHQIIRHEIFPRIKDRMLVPHAGNHLIKDETIIEKVHRGFLFNGAVTAGGSVSAVYETVPLSIIQIAVCLINYFGQQGSYSHRMYRKDLHQKSGDSIGDLLNLIERRAADSTGRSRSKLSALAVRGIKAYAERKILLEKSTSNWLLAGGSPTPYELMTGFWASRTEMKEKSIELMRGMVLDHQRFVYVQSSANMGDLWTLGSALYPLEYLVLDTMEDNLIHMVESGGTRGEFYKGYLNFAREVGPKIVRGLFKVSRQAPPQLFYCHIDHIQTAVLIAIADSVLQLHQGSPMLLDLANHLCQNAFGKNDFFATIEQAYVNADISLRIQA